VEDLRELPEWKRAQKEGDDKAGDGCGTDRAASEKIRGTEF